MGFNIYILHTLGMYCIFMCIVWDFVYNAYLYGRCVVNVKLFLFNNNNIIPEESTQWKWNNRVVTQPGHFNFTAAVCLFIYLNWCTTWCSSNYMLLNRLTVHTIRISVFQATLSRQCCFPEKIILKCLMKMAHYTHCYGRP